MLLASLLIAAVAGSPSPSPSPSPIPEIAHVYTSDRHDETLNNAVRTTYVVTRADIDRNGYRTIGEAIAALPAVEISPYGPIGAAVQSGIRGSSSAQTLFLIDGLPAPGSFSNTVEIGTLPTTGVERIEVVEGGGSTLYGTGAIGGIINIITQSGARTGATVAAGTFEYRQLAVATDHLQFSRTLATNAYELPDGTTRSNQDYEATALHANERWRMGSFDALLRAGAVDQGEGAPDSAAFFSPTSREHDLNQNVDLLLSRSTARAQTSFQLGGTNQRITFSCNALVDANCFTPVPALNTEGRVSFGARNLVSAEGETLLYGIDLARGSVRADSGGTVMPNVTWNALAQTAAYAQQSRTWHGGSVYYGIRGERDGRLGGEFSPSLGFMARVGNDLTIKGNAADAFRAPNASELYFPFYGNPKLRPERAQVADLTLVQTIPQGSVSLGWFTNRTNDLIAFDPATFQAKNIHHAFIQGLTFDLHSSPFRGVSASLNVTDLYRAQDLDAHARLPDDPVLSVNLELRYAGSETDTLESLGAVVHSAGARAQAVAGVPFFEQAAAYTTLNAYARFRIAPSALLSIRGYNLGNARYSAVSGYPLPGRSLIVELSTR